MSEIRWCNSIQYPEYLHQCTVTFPLCAHFGEHIFNGVLMDKQKVIIIGTSRNILGKSRFNIDHLLAMGYGLEYLKLDTEFTERSPDLVIYNDFSKLEDRIMAELVRTGTVGRINNVMFKQSYMMLPPDQVKGPKGPRGKWGKIK